MVRSTFLLTLLAMAMFLALSHSCADAEESVTSQPLREQRIVSLSPAISRTLVDLDLASQVVGRTPFCDSLNDAVPIVGDLLNLDYEQLIRVNPTHVLVQPPATGIDRQLVQLVEQQQWQLGSWRLNHVADIDRLLHELPTVLGTADIAQRAAVLREAMDQAMRRDDAIWTGPTLIVSSIDPVGAFGTGTYLHDVLTSLGGNNVITAANYPQLTLEDITRLNPTAIILVRPGAALDTDPITTLRSLGRLDIAAIHKHRIAVLSHPDAYLPSSAIVGVAGELRLILRSFTAQREPSP